jgi:hypothetical protein
MALSRMTASARIGRARYIDHEGRAAGHRAAGGAASLALQGSGREGGGPPEPKRKGDASTLMGWGRRQRERSDGFLERGRWGMGPRPLDVLGGRAEARPLGEGKGKGTNQSSPSSFSG